MTINVLLLVLALSAVTFALLYGPALNRFSLSLASPYPKADVKRRLLAGSVDGSLLVTSLYFYQNSGSAWFVVAGAAYVTLRDAMQGRSVGKFLVGLVVISLETGRPCTLVGSVRRNLVFLFPGVNVVAVFLEAISIVRDPLGHRLGDRMALTQVVVGFGARDFAASLVQGVRQFKGAIRDSPRTGTYHHSPEGQWSIPRGVVEEGESPADAALRESREEGGVEIEVEGLLEIQDGPVAVEHRRIGHH